MNREEMLDEAKKNVTGHRVQDYGKVEHSFEAIADYWNVYLAHIGRTKLTPRDAATMLALFKMARLTTGTATEDSYVDAAGYLACAVELKDQERFEEVPTVVLPLSGKPDDIKNDFTYTDEGGV